MCFLLVITVGKCFRHIEEADLLRPVFTQLNSIRIANLYSTLPP